MNALTADEFARLYILPNGWATDLAVVPVVANGTIGDHFGCSTRQLRKGGAFSEERYIRRVMVNVSAPYADCILIRSICVPSMKSGLYKQLVARNQNSVVVKAHCDCVAGLSETCQHVAALIFVIADIQQTSSTGSRYLWNMPSQNAKRACPAPLKDITFKKHVVHKKKEVKVKRQLLSVSAPSGGCLDDVKHYVDAIQSKEPGLLWCGYVGQPEPPRFQCPILDDEDLHSKKCRQLFRAQMEAIRPLELAEASAICSATVGQGRNPSWKRERVGRITASNFRPVVHCQQPESLVREILYPQNVKLKPGDPRLYGIENEGKAVQQYLELMTYYDKEVRVEETGLHVYHEYPCIGASPDRIVYDGEEVGVLEVKCPLSKKGQTPKAAALEKTFYAYILEGEVTLKWDSAHYYQVQGQLAVAGFPWADFVIWTNNGSVVDSVSVERIAFNRTFWDCDVLPGLLYFYEYAVIPEMVTRRIRRLAKLHTTEPGHVQHKMRVESFSFSRSHDDPLKLTIARIQ